MIHLSVNLNKIATLRNSRGGEIPSLLEAANVVITSGAKGITFHPREDERHIKRSDIPVMKEFLRSKMGDDDNKIEFNLEGDPSERFLKIALEFAPEQVTLVPVKEGEITSDHGFDFSKDWRELEVLISKIKKAKTSRISLFVDLESGDLGIAKKMGADRVEFYTGPFAHEFEKSGNRNSELLRAFEGNKNVVMTTFLKNNPTHANSPLLQLFHQYCNKAEEALEAGLEINAGHDLDHENLILFRHLPGLKEVSIGHRLISQSLFWGLEKTVREYVRVLNLQ